MFISVDIGNTNITFSIIKDNIIVYNFRLDSTYKDLSYFINELNKNIKKISKKLLNQINSSLIISVVPHLTTYIDKAIEIVLHIKSDIINYKDIPFLTINTDFPEKTGIDRLTIAVGALLDYRPPFILIDLGTATTIDVVNKDLQFLGGFIFPGLNTLKHSLCTATSQLPLIDLDSKSKNIIGTNTNDSIRNGIIYGSACMLNGLISIIENELNENTTIISTGGLCEYIIPLLDKRVIIDKNLVEKGMIQIYNHLRLN